MPSRVVCISRTLGAGGEEVGYAVASSLGFRYIDEEIVVRAATQADVEPAIVAHAAAQALGPRAGVLRVLVTASPQTRERRVAAARRLSERDAANVIERSDGERRDYFRRFHNVDDEQPTDYDLVINTDLLSVEQTPGWW